MTASQCAQCGRQLGKNYTRCGYCEDLKYQAELVNLEPKNIKKKVSRNNLGDLQQSISEMKHNKKLKKITLKQSELDAALSWGNAIAEINANDKGEISNNLPKQKTKFCSSCGQKLNYEDIYCSKCGNNLQENIFHSETRNNIKPKRSRRRLLLPMIAIFVILILFKFISSQDLNNPNPSGSSNNTPAIDQAKQEGHWVSKCRTEWVPNPNYDPYSTTYDNTRTQTIPINKCTDVYVQP
jgi:hypothetical protein